MYLAMEKKLNNELWKEEEGKGYQETRAVFV